MALALVHSRARSGLLAPLSHSGGAPKPGFTWFSVGWFT